VDAVFTIAGQPGTSAAATDGAVATATPLKDPYSVAYDTSGNLFILESGFTGRLYQVVPSGIIKDLTLGGNTFLMASDVFTLANGSLVVLMGDAHHACMYTSPTSCVTVAGTASSAGYSGDGAAATAALLRSPQGGVGHPTNPNRFWIAGGWHGAPAVALAVRRSDCHLPALRPSTLKLAPVLSASAPSPPLPSPQTRTTTWCAWWTTESSPPWPATARAAPAATTARPPRRC
jgi:hypothetical protein